MPKDTTTALTLTAAEEAGDEWSFTDAEKDALAQEISDGELADRFRSLDDAQERWERLRYKAVAKIPCPECSGAGQVIGGVLGDICVNCGGQRVVDDPDAEDFAMPNFPKLRAALATYGRALDDRALPDGHRVKQGLALPPASSVPSRSAIEKLNQKAKDVSRQLRAAPATPAPQLAEAKRAKGLAGEGDLGEYADGEMDEMISDAEEV